MDAYDHLHASSSWLAALEDLDRSPNTAEHYGRRVVRYLNWTLTTADWRAVSVNHLVLWRRALMATSTMNAETVDAHIIAIRSFYEWAATRELVRPSVAAQFSEMKWFAPGSPAGGEHGRHRSVTAERLRGEPRKPSPPPRWISDRGARDRLETLALPARDRFLIDLLYFTGIRVGEAASLFTADMHLGGGTRSSGCNIRDPHFHVKMDNPVTNGARAKGAERTLFAKQLLVDGYIDYVIQRREILGNSDNSPHMLVNLYTHGRALGEAMKEDRIAEIVEECGKKIDYPLSGPHMLRHTFATRLVRGYDVPKQPLEVVQALMGHRSKQSTQIYVHDVEIAMVAALDSLPTRRLNLETRRD
ncbi:tyrosine-type recombinase/integrase [Curtobacterium sp. MCLR17_007]|uniref:tyrosine-type recombinase/integrase n=1 Tax=unclassified Curtobacterium TaxID=257496 RepID=UPI0011B38AED|nr:tyrosine-type recombinase/integrase [Curtobacterium sp. MCLR17_007]WIB60992.1 tyrosine-type recombinase/integrase [Curtobacterium sp. MCLR17_007]